MLLFFLKKLLYIQAWKSVKKIDIIEAKWGLYVFHKSDFDALHSIKNIVNVIFNSFNDWHYRLRHPSNTRLSVLYSCCPSILPVNNSLSCNICHIAKQNKLPFFSSKTRSEKTFELVHANIWSPFSTFSISGHKHFVTIMDYYSRYICVFLINSKSKAMHILQTYVRMVETQFEAKVKKIKGDNGS